MIMTLLVMLLISPHLEVFILYHCENNWPPYTQMVPSGHSHCGQNIRIQYGFMWASSTALERLVAPLSGRSEPWGADVASPQGQSGRVLTDQNRSSRGVATWLAIVLHIPSHSHNTACWWQGLSATRHCCLQSTQSTRHCQSHFSWGFSQKLRLSEYETVLLTSTETGVVLNIAM